MSDPGSTPTQPEPTEPTTGSAPAPAEPTRAEPERPAQDSSKDPLRRSRTSGVWFAVVALAVLLLLLIVFIAQNTEKVNVAFFGFDGQAPLAVTILISVLVGLLLAVFAGSLRILQLRRRVRRGHR
jgi:uncharacterized integral membrane protein